MSTAENIQTMQAFLGYFNPAEAKCMAQGGGARFGGEGETAGAERIQTLQAFLGYFNPAEASLMEQGGGARPEGAREATSVGPVSTSTSHAAGKGKPDMSTAKRIQTLQAFLGYFNPAEAERMAQGGGARPGGDSEPSREDKAVEHWLQPDVLALLQELEAVPTAART
jgi:hypothetical protein